jgi:hypothetical protein
MIDTLNEPDNMISLSFGKKRKFDAVSVLPRKNSRYSHQRPKTPPLNTNDRKSVAFEFECAKVSKPFLPIAVIDNHINEIDGHFLCWSKGLGEMD